VKLLATTNYDCTDSLSTNINFHPTPKTLFTINDSTQCYNNHSFNIKNNSTLASGTYTQKWWMDDNTNYSTFDILNKKFMQPLWHQFYLSILSNNNCSDTLNGKVYLEKNKNIGIQLVENDSQCLINNAYKFNINNNNSLMAIQSANWQFGDSNVSNNITPSVYKYLKNGNYTVNVSIISKTGCLDTAQMPVEIMPHPINSFSAPEVCFPESIQFTNSSTIVKGNIVAYKWHFGDNKTSIRQLPSHNYKSAGYYNVMLTSVSNFGCTDTLKIPNAAIVKPKPMANFNFVRLPTINQDETQLQYNNLSSSDVVRYNWDFGNNTNSIERNPIGLYNDTGNFKVTHIVWNNLNCSDTMIKNTGHLFPDFFMFVPTAFSPNKNGINEVFKPVGSRYTYYYTMEIFNRWGEMVFKTNDVNAGWDGKYQNQECMEGVYICRIYAVPFYGFKRALNSTFTLLR